MKTVKFITIGALLSLNTISMQYITPSNVAMAPHQYRTHPTVSEYFVAQDPFFSTINAINYSQYIPKNCEDPKYLRNIIHLINVFSPGMIQPCPDAISLLFKETKNVLSTRNSENISKLCQVLNIIVEKKIMKPNALNFFLERIYYGYEKKHEYVDMAPEMQFTKPFLYLYYTLDPNMRIYVFNHENYLKSSNIDEALNGIPATIPSKKLILFEKQVCWALTCIATNITNKFSEEQTVTDSDLKKEINSKVDEVLQYFPPFNKFENFKSELEHSCNYFINTYIDQKLNNQHKAFQEYFETKSPPELFKIISEIPTPYPLKISILNSIDDLLNKLMHEILEEGYALELNFETIEKGLIEKAQELIKYRIQERKAKENQKVFRPALGKVSEQALNTLVELYNQILEAKCNIFLQDEKSKYLEVNREIIHLNCENLKFHLGKLFIDLIDFYTPEKESFYSQQFNQRINTIIDYYIKYKEMKYSIKFRATVQVLYMMMKKKNKIKLSATVFKESAPEEISQESLGFLAKTLLMP